MMAKPMKTLELHYPMIQFLIITFITRGKKEIHRISLQTRSRMAAVSCFCVMILRWKKSRLIRYGESWPISARIPWKLTFNIDNKVFYFAWLTKTENRSRSLWHPRLQPAWPAVESSCIRSFRASRTLLCFDKNLQTHQSVDSRNGIIAFLFNPFSAKDVLIDFTLSNARRFYSSKGTPWHRRG